MAENTFPTTGDVGIGTTSPRLISGSVKRLLEVAGTHNAGLALRATDTGGSQWLIYSTESNSGDFRIFDATHTKERLAINNRGDVGIGTTKPAEKLEVDGNILVTGDVQLAGSDCAEEFAIDAHEPIDAGTVMVFSQEGHLRQSFEAYDRKVAGVVSGAGNYRPGLILGRQKDQPADGHAAIALIGRVFCKVDADLAAIEVGDLLTTSPTPGHAMKATDPARAFGAVLGKALSPSNEGRGLIPIMVALQ